METLRIRKLYKFYIKSQQLEKINCFLGRFFYPFETAGLPSYRTIQCCFLVSGLIKNIAGRLPENSFISFVELQYQKNSKKRQTKKNRLFIEG